jgi:predicted PurR-regulated permease PerM
MDEGRSRRRFFFVLLIVALVLFGYTAWPIAAPLFWAATLAGVLWPVHSRFSRWLRGRRHLSAVLLVLGMSLLVLVPLVAFSTVLIREGSKGVGFVTSMFRSASVEEALGRLPASVGEPIRHLVDALPGDFDASMEKLKSQVASKGAHAAAAVGATVSATLHFLFKAAMMLIAFYFLLLQGDQLVAWLDGLSPLKKGQTRELFTEIKRISYAVILSTVITAAVQALAAMIGYFIARVPHPLFFTGLTFLIAFIPAVGAGVVCLFVALLVYLTGHPYAALFLALWGLLVVSLVDNLVKPLLIKAGMQMNGAVVFFSLIGGLAAFGAPGLLLGPLIVTLLLALLRIYQRDFKPDAAQAP